MDPKDQEDQTPEVKQEDSKIDDILKNLNLGEAELLALKNNKSALDIVVNSIQSKRDANQQAKKERESREAIEAKLEAEEKDKLEKKGEFEKLYQDANEKLTVKDQAIKNALVKGELSRLAGANGLAKQEYLKLLDTTSIQVDTDTLEVTGADEAFNAFKENNPELFKAYVPTVDNGQPQLNKAPQGEMAELKQLEEKAKSGLPRDLAAYKAKKVVLQQKGLV